MSRYQLLDATPEHVRLLGGSLRPMDREEIACGFLGAPRRALWHCYRNSVMRRTAVIDGEIAAMWGVGGVLLGGTGTPFFLTGPAIEKLPVALVKEGRKEVARMLDIYPVLQNYVLASYRGAVRLIEVVGFELGEPEPRGRAGALFRRFRMERAA